MFLLEYDDVVIFTNCLCGEKNDFMKYVAYTDIEMDNYTLELDIGDPISLLQSPPRDLWSCAKCNRFYIKEKQKESIIVY
ncbi:hypothetical protein ACFSCX_09685 [Bacillus salitolerans]|uniref:CxxH/CxxC protein n=1 Tax=Bacillus salitolerans TaxID=1437434 RepID=A0ABW4LQ66_9BACI